MWSIGRGHTGAIPAFCSLVTWKAGNPFFAGCITNVLLDRDVPILRTNFPSILNQMTGVFAEDRVAFIASLDDYSLLVIDDFHGADVHRH